MPDNDTETPIEKPNGKPNGKPTVTGSEQAALLLLMLGEVQAAEVLRHVDAEEVEKIGTAMAAISSVDSERADAVYQSFQRDLPEQTPLGVGVPNYVRKLLVSTMGDQKGSTLADKLLGGEEPLEIDSLRWMELDTVVQMLRDEHPQIIAITLAHLEKDKAASIIGKLPEELQDDVVFRIATMDRIPQEALRQLQSTLKNKLSLSASFKSKAVDGAKTAADIINFLGVQVGDRMLDIIGSSDQALRDRVQELMFVFSNLASVDNKGMQMLLREISTDLLSVALKGAEEPVRDKIFANMSSRAKEMLLEDMEAKGPVKISDVEAAQKEILEVARRLAENGQITLSSGGEEFVE